MAEQTFKSPGFFEREIDLSQRDSEIVGVPAGVVGTAYGTCICTSYGWIICRF